MTMPSSTMCKPSLRDSACGRQPPTAWPSEAAPADHGEVRRPADAIDIHANYDALIHGVESLPARPPCGRQAHAAWPGGAAPAEHREWRLAAAHCRDADALRRCVCREASFAGDSDGLDRPVSPALSGTSSTF